MHKHPSVNKGAIVWARVQFPHQWWPALVLTTDSLGVCVSFFNHDVSPRYFIESEVVPFEDSFRWLMGHQKNVKKCETFYALLDSALRLLGQRVISNLKCPCQMAQRDYGCENNGRATFDGSNKSFQPNGLLGFVLKVAVFPWVDTSDFIDAVRVVAQVQAFRGYCSIEQKRVYKNTQERGNDVKLHLCSSLGEKMNSATQESVVLQPEYECQILPKQVEENLATGAIKRLNSGIPVLKGNAETFYGDQVQVIPQTQIENRKAEFLEEISPHLGSVSLDPFHFMRESVQSVKQRLLGFKKISGLKIVDFCFKNCSKMSKSYFVNSRKDNAPELLHRFPYIATTTYLTNKRRRLDQPALSDCSFKLQRISSSSINEASVSLQMLESGTKEDDSDAFVSSSALADCFSNCTKKEMDSYLASFLQSPIKLEIQKPCPNQGLSVAHIGGRSWMELLYNSYSCMSLFKDRPDRVDFPQMDRVQEIEGNGHISKNTRPCRSGVKMLEPEKCIQKHNQGCICFYETTEKFTNEVRKADVKKSKKLTLQQSDFVLGTHSNNYEVETRAVTIKSLLGSDSTLDHNRLQISSGGDTTPLKSKKPARGNLSSSGFLIENENLYQSDTSYSMFNSKVGQQSKAPIPSASSTSLLMKFPKNFNLPSKWELIKKFSVFGSIDYLKTRVFCSAGSARVAFFQEADAVTAYLHAKKICFGQANVRFWLDPFEQKRRGSHCSALKIPLASESVPLKSCLKNSSSLKRDNRKKPCRVRFTV